MSFVSPEFVVFFAVVIPAYFWVHSRYRWLLLLVVSYFFYAYGQVQFLPLIILSTAADYIAARMISRTEQEWRRRAWLVVSITFNLGVLFVFKYLNFFMATLAGGADLLDMTYEPLRHDLLLPIGISFYTFQSMSYTFDVYRRRIEPEPNPGIFAAYVSFFPQLVAGPIERAAHLLPQFHKQHTFDIDGVVEGFQRILWGAFKKMVIADRVAIYVNTVYGDVESYSGQVLILATVFFAFQIYCDFSGYSDIAIGTARVMGFRLMENFRQPYFATSIRDFWRRWHISLSSWFLHYVYIPLGGNRVSLLRHIFNLMVVFLLSGLWHGAGWTFIVWGGLHGLALSGEVLVGRWSWRVSVPAVVRWLSTFALVCAGWIFFRADSLADALYVYGHLLNFAPNVDVSAPFAMALLPAQTELWLSLGLVGGLMVVDGLNSRWALPVLLARTPSLLRWGVYYAFGAAVIFASIYGTSAQQFIYFQF